MKFALFYEIPVARPWDAESEHRSAAQPGPARILSSGDDLWVTAPDGELQASILRYG